MNHDTDDVLQILPDGGNQPVTKEQLDAMKQGIMDVTTSESGIWLRPSESDALRLARWENQSMDGRKWDTKEKKARPYNGAADGQVFLIDLVLRFKTAFKIAAVSRSLAAVLPMESGDAEYAGRIQTLIQWLNKNLWGGRGRRQLKLAANWIGQDGFAALATNYHRAEGLRNEAVDVDWLVQAVVADAIQAGRVQDEDDADVLSKDTAAMFRDRERAEEAKALLGAIFPDLSAKRINRMALELRREGETLAPVTVTYGEGPRPEALRLGHDIFFDTDCRDIQDAPYVFHVEWLTRSRLESRAKAEGWEEAFVVGMLGEQEGDAGTKGKVSFFYWGDQVSDFAGITAIDKDLRQNRYEVVTCYRKATDDQGRVGVYRAVFSAFLDVAATDNELVNDTGGRYPLVVLTNEILSARLLDSRGWAEILGTAQGLIKWLRDLGVSVTALKTFPPMRGPKDRMETELHLAPMAVIRERRPNETGVFNEFDYPDAALKISDIMRKEAYELAGLPHKEVPELVSQMFQQDELDDYLAGVTDFYHLVISQLVANMPPERLEAIAGGPIDMQTADELDGRFNVHLSFDPRHMDKEFVKEWLETMVNLILPTDTNSIILRDEITRIGLRMWDPTLTDRATRGTESAMEEETKAEQDEIARILAGFDPNLMEYEVGVNWQVRLDVLRGWMQGNPQRMAQLDDITLQRLDMHAANLEQMLQQAQNEQTGRTGVAAPVEDLGTTEPTENTEVMA